MKNIGLSIICLRGLRLSIFVFVYNVYFIQANSTVTGIVPQSLVYRDVNFMSKVSRKHCLIIYYFIFAPSDFHPFPNRKKQFHARIQKFLPEGYTFDNVFCVCFFIYLFIYLFFS